ALSRLPSRSKDNKWAPSPASNTAPAALACAAVTGLPRTMPRAISATAARIVHNQASRPAACKLWWWSRASSRTSQQNMLSTASAPIHRAANESTWTARRWPRTVWDRSDDGTTFRTARESGIRESGIEAIRIVLLPWVARAFLGPPRRWWALRRTLSGSAWQNLVRCLTRGGGATQRGGEPISGPQGWMWGNYPPLDDSVRAVSGRPELSVGLWWIAPNRQPRK